MKPFSLFITELNGGQSNAALTSHLDELLRAVKLHGLAGKLKLTINVAPATKGGTDVDKILVACDSQLTLPKPSQPTDMFFLTDDALPTRQHPRQHDLPGLREVPSGATPAQKFSAPDDDGVITEVAGTATNLPPLKEVQQ